MATEPCNRVECIHDRNNKELQRTRSLRCLIRCEELLSEALLAQAAGKYHVMTDHAEVSLMRIKQELMLLRKGA